MTHNQDYPSKVLVNKRIWQENNRDKVRAYSKKWRQKNKDKSRLYYKKWAQLNKSNLRNSINYRYDKYKHNAKKRNYIFELSKMEFAEIVGLPCHYCGDKTSKIGIDRKSNTIGYVTENILPCCGLCNRLKGSLDYNVFLKLCENITATKRG